MKKDRGVVFSEVSTACRRGVRLRGRRGSCGTGVLISYQCRRHFLITILKLKTCSVLLISM